MSEDAAYRRVAAARLVQRFPLLFGAIERGELHLTGLLLLGPHLTEANLLEVLARAQFRTKKEIVKLVRLISPLPDIAGRIEPLGLAQGRPAPRATWANLIAARHPVRNLPMNERPSEWLPSGEFHLPALGSTAATLGAIATVEADRSEAEAPALQNSEPIEPIWATLAGPQRYAVQFTAGEEYVALLEEAKALLSHALPSADLAEIHLRALRALVNDLKKRKFATVTRRVEASTTTPARSHHAPAPTPHVPTPHAPAPGAPAPARDAEAEEPIPSPRGHSATPSPRQREATPPPRQREAIPPSRQREPTPSPRQRVRTIPAAVRRLVFERDGNRCAYVDERGVRCRETSHLEFHHHQPFAHGGPPTAENISLHCASHNALAADRDFGRTFATTSREHSHVSERHLARAVHATHLR